MVPRLIGQAPPPTAAQGEATVPLGPAVNGAALAALGNVVLTHGWQDSGVSTAPNDPTGFGASFAAMAQRQRQFGQGADAVF